MDDDIRMRVKMELPFLVRVLASDAVENLKSAVCSKS